MHIPGSLMLGPAPRRPRGPEGLVLPTSVPGGRPPAPDFGVADGRALPAGLTRRGGAGRGRRHKVRVARGARGARGAL